MKEQETCNTKEKFLKETMYHLINEFKPHEQREFLNNINSEISRHYENVLAEKEKLTVIAKENLDIYLDNQAVNN